jgi:hypothetical protein
VAAVGSQTGVFLGLLETRFNTLPFPVMVTEALEGTKLTTPPFLSSGSVGVLSLIIPVPVNTDNRPVFVIVLIGPADTVRPGLVGAAVRDCIPPLKI